MGMVGSYSGWVWWVLGGLMILTLLIKNISPTLIFPQQLEAEAPLWTAFSTGLLLARRC